jgi:hypothetical protein
LTICCSFEIPQEGETNVEDNPYIVYLTLDEFHELISEYENYVEWCHKEMDTWQRALAERVLAKPDRQMRDMSTLMRVVMMRLHYPDKPQIAVLQALPRWAWNRILERA